MAPAGEGVAVSGVEPGEFRSLMATFPSGVTVVTAFDHDGRPWGMTCSALCSVAVDPPTLLVSLRHGPTAAAVVAGGRFTVNLLHEAAREVAEAFARAVPDRFGQVRWAAGPCGAHLVDAAHRVADCVVVATRQVGDHQVVFGEVRSLTVLREGPPLLYGLREFGYWSRATGSTRQRGQGESRSDRDVDGGRRRNG